MVRCALCNIKVGDGPKYRKHKSSLRHTSNEAKKMDPHWVDLRATSVPTRKLEALGLGKNRWITAEQHALVLTLKRIVSSGIPEDCFTLTGCNTKMGFCSEEERARAQALLDARTVRIRDTKLELSRFKALGIRGEWCTEEELERASLLTSRKDAGLSHSSFGEEVDAVWCSPAQLEAARAKWTETCDWLPAGTNNPKDQVIFAPRKQRPTSGRRVEVVITPTLGGAFLPNGIDDDASTSEYTGRTTERTCN